MSMSCNIEFVKFDIRFLEKSYEWLSDNEIRQLIDSPKISKAEQMCWFQNLPNKKDYYIKGVLVDKKPVGCVGIKHIDITRGEYWGYIGEKSYWGKGIGSLMVTQMIKDANEKFCLKELILKVLISNKRAVGLYKKIGFSIVDSDEIYYRMNYLIR